MKCDNSFCIYWSQAGCVLDCISLDLQGRCEACVYVDLDEAVLEQARAKILQSYEAEEAKWAKRP